MSTISQRVGEAIEDSLSRGLGQGQKIEYDVSLLAMPTQSGRPQPMIGVAFTIQGSDLAEGHSIMLVMPPSVPSQEDIDGMVRQVVQGLMETKAMAAAQVMTSSNGHKEVPVQSRSGLILPGQN